jgi:hypothetical protein
MACDLLDKSSAGLVVNELSWDWGYTMVSTWWLIATFLAGGYAGFLLFAMLSVSKDTADDAQGLIVHRKGGPRTVAKGV